MSDKMVTPMPAATMLRTASTEEVVTLLNALGKRTGLQGEADRMARLRQTALGRASLTGIIQGGLHEWLSAFIAENGKLDQAIAAQFRFT